MTLFEIGFLIDLANISKRGIMYFSKQLIVKMKIIFENCGEGRLF